MNKTYLKIIMVLYFVVDFSINFNLVAKTKGVVNKTVLLSMSSVTATTSNGSIDSTKTKKCEKILQTLIGRTVSVNYVYNFSTKIGEAVATSANLFNGKIILHPEGISNLLMFISDIKNEKTLIVGDYKLQAIFFKIPSQLTMSFNPIVITGDGTKDLYCELSSI